MPPTPDYAVDLADHYDDWFTPPTATTDATVALLNRLAATAPDGPLLELGIGTGRIALPLASLGHDLHGVDAAKAMVEQLRAKPGGAELAISIGDFSEVDHEGRFGVIYVVNGTFFELPSQEAQIRCLTRAAARLLPGGLFVLDAHLPEALAAGAGTGAQSVQTVSGDPVTRIRRIHPATQRYTSDYKVVDNGSVRHVRVAFRYASTGELDLMAATAGLQLRERFGGWSGVPFTDSSSYHVSVYELPA
ncbi:class I SAM-dependent DNA methyltransferase [Streptomyces rhizosphaerihabitans]|uniref:class I SAM-dependent DNA methyltransferase n=1 Tax=Streptomyces rhizosphaerihabitans TaxID=1266770 RepID=UPI0021C1D000|nr:class I SAM-dependent methyltransferase [Streptomyces rhizosphaerihabitans]MCT9011636.1 class I SAM-dependent methyltransferase [Streptomyces rhizosphaerihabitans]